MNRLEGLQMLKNSGWLFFDKIFRQGLNFLLTAYIARYLGVAEFGQWNYAMAFVALFSFFSTLGLYNILVRDFVHSPEKSGQIMASAIALRLAGGCLTLLFSVCCILILKPDENALHLLVFITTANYVAQSFDVIDFYFQSGLKSNWIAAARGLSFIIFAAIKLAFVHFSVSVFYFASAQAAELVLAAALLLFFLSRTFPLKSLMVTMSTIRRLVAESMPLLFSEIAIIIYMRTDQIMIGEMIGNSALGNYSAAVKVSEIWYFIPGVICSTFFPTIIRAHIEGGEQYRIKLQMLYDFLSGISIGIGLFISITSFWIVQLLFGPEYGDAHIALTIHIWAGVFVFWGFASNQQLVIEHLTHISLYRTIFGMIVNVVFNFILIPRMGIAGSALATLLAQAFSAWISSLFFKESRPIFWMGLRSLNLFRFIALVSNSIKKGHL